MQNSPTTQVIMLTLRGEAEHFSQMYRL